MIIGNKFSGYSRDNRRLYFSDGGPSTPSKTTQIADLPEWAKPTAQRLLAKSEALTDGAPYQTYTGERSAQFTPLQKQAFDSAASMDAGPQAFGQQVGQYMSPYMQNVINSEKLEAARASQMLGQQQQAQATQAGAFGGYREAIQRAERERGLRSQMQDIQTRGLQSAYDRAADQFRTGINQNMAINQQQAQLGGYQQQQVQGILDRQYQDFQNQQRHPYQQLEFMSNILRGTPMGTVSTMYAPGPSAMQSLGSLGLGAYGLSQLMRAEGGAVSSYAGGGSVTDEEFVSGALKKLSDAQLQQELQEAAQSGNESLTSMLKAEMDRRASMRTGDGAGLSSLFTSEMADQVLPSEESMARGGIVAFAKAGQIEDEDGEDDGELPAGLAGMLTPSAGNPDVYRAVTGAFPALLAYAAKSKYTPMTDEAYNAAIAKRRAMLEEAAGPSPYEGLRAQVQEMRDGSEKNLAQGRGLAALQAAAALSQGSNFVRGLGQAGGAFAQSYGQALAADRAEKKAMASMEFNIADAERKERAGLTRDAIAAADQARRDHDSAQSFGLKKVNALASLTAKMASATKPTGKSGAGAGGEKPLKINEQLAAAEVAFEANPTEANKQRVTALRRAVDRVRTSDVGPGRTAVESFRTTSTADTEVEKQVRQSRFSDAAWMAAYERNDPQAMAAAEDAIANRIRARRTATAPGAANPAPAASAAAPARPASAASTPVTNNSGQAQPNRLRFNERGELIP